MRLATRPVMALTPDRGYGASVTSRVPAIVGWMLQMKA